MKKALLVGINEYGIPNSNLRGCVNDVIHMREVLNKVYKFPLDNIRVLTDKRAVRNAIIDRLNWLLDGVSSGDELVFHFAGHGSQVRDRNNDELTDHLDEIICPYNMDWNNPLTDDMIGRVFERLPSGAFLNMIADCCHSGSISRSFFDQNKIHSMFENKERFLSPPIDIQSRSEGRKLKVNKVGIKQRNYEKEDEQRHILMAGCQDNQTSADAYIDGKFQGAFTHMFIKSLQQNPNASWGNLAGKVSQLLKENGFQQNPRLSGNNELINRKIFGGT